MNIADVASQVGTVYDRTLHTSLTLPYSGFENIAIAQNDVVTSAVINNAIDKLYSNYIQLYRYSNVASNVIPISSIAFAGALLPASPIYNVTLGTKTLTSYITTPVYSVTPSTQTDTFIVSSYKTVTQDLTSYTNQTIVSYYENLLFYSGQLDNTTYWYSTDSAIAATELAPPFNDGTTTWKITESNTKTLQYVAQKKDSIIQPGLPYIFTVYAKAGERQYLTLWFQDSDYSIFDLKNGTVSTVKNNAAFSLHNNNGSITYVGNGWYQCTLSLIVNTTTVGYAVGMGPAISKTDIPIYKGDGKSGIYVWGPQLVYGTRPYPYMETKDVQVGNLVAAPTTQAHTQVFTSSTQWRVPAGISAVNVSVVGGGGGGGGGYWGGNISVDTAYGGGGGGSGGYSTGAFAVTAGSVIPIFVGRGGAGGSGGTTTNISNGTKGGNSTFGSLLTATGGAGGGAASKGTVGIGGIGGSPGGHLGSSGSTIPYSSANIVFTAGAGGKSPYQGYGAGGDGSNNGIYDGGGTGVTGGNGAVIITYNQVVVPPNIQPLVITTVNKLANVTQESTLVPVFQKNTNTYTTYLSTVKYVTTAQITPISYNVYTPSTTLQWYTTTDFLSTSQFLPLATTQYLNLDNIKVITGGINDMVTPSKYVIFASTGTDLIALTGDTNLQNISVALSTNTTALFSNVYFTGINKLLLDSNTNHLYAVDLSANLIHQFDASGFLTNDNILANKLIYIKSIGGYGGYDDAHLFNNPQSIIISNSNLYVLDSGNNCIKQYDTDLNWITTYRLFRDFYNNYPIDMSVDGDGNIYVLTNTNILIRYSNNFNTKTVITLPTLYNADEYYQNIVTSITYSDIFYLVTNMNVYKKFYSAINDTIGNYLFYRFNVTPGENIIGFTSLINANNSDTNVIFSTYNGVGKFGFYADNINLDTVLVTDNFDVYPLSAIQINNDEYVQNWVFNKAIAKLIINHTRLRNLIFSRFLYEPDDHGTLIFQGTRYLTSDETLSVTFDQDMQNFIGCNEIFQNIIVNRSLRAVYDAQVAIFNMLQLDVQTAPDLNIPVYIN